MHPRPIYLSRRERGIWPGLRRGSGPLVHCWPCALFLHSLCGERQPLSVWSTQGLRPEPRTISTLAPRALAVSCIPGTASTSPQPESGSTDPHLEVLSNSAPLSWRPSPLTPSPTPISLRLPRDARCPAVSHRRGQPRGPLAHLHTCNPPLRFPASSGLRPSTGWPGPGPRGPPCSGRQRWAWKLCSRRPESPPHSSAEPAGTREALGPSFTFTPRETCPYV